MNVILRIGELAVPTTLAAFLEENDGLDPDEASEIRADLARQGFYTGGGGAAPVWTLEPAP